MAKKVVQWIMSCQLSQKATDQREDLASFDNWHLAAQHYFHIAVFVAKILDLPHVAFFLVLLWRGKLTNIFHKSSYCSMCDDGIPFFEISAINADKPPLSISEIKRRVEQFRKAGMDAFHFAILLACCLDCHSNLCKRGSICIKRTRVLFTIHICVHSV